MRKRSGPKWIPPYHLQQAGRRLPIVVWDYRIPRHDDNQPVRLHRLQYLHHLGRRAVLPVVEAVVHPERKYCGYGS
uniref:Uncharacterized protein n=1 Tax=Pristionchus pacificus TaxID=54126 RepID=A0A2A6B4S3_PRIPA|eukprot:PDM60858.1 hypothetical protein PRIPAC_54664 [Pristionchus pacificus]